MSTDVARLLETAEGSDDLRWGYLAGAQIHDVYMSEASWCEVMAEEAGDRAARIPDADLFKSLEGLDANRINWILDAVGQMLYNAIETTAAVALAATRHGATPSTTSLAALEKRLAFLAERSRLGDVLEAVTDPKRVATLEREHRAYVDRVMKQLDQQETKP